MWYFYLFLSESKFECNENITIILQVCPPNCYEHFKAKKLHVIVLNLVLLTTLCKKYGIFVVFRVKQNKSVIRTFSLFIKNVEYNPTNNLRPKKLNVIALNFDLLLILCEK
jgi:hypothetical protein